MRPSTRLRADAELGALRPNQQRHAILRRHLVDGIDGDRRAADVVGVQAVAGIAVELGLVPGPKHDAGLRARHRCLGIAGIFRRVAEHAPRKDVLADANRGAQPIGPACRRVGPDADIAFLHAVLAHGRKQRTLLGLEQADMDVVIAALHADAGLSLEAAKAPVEGMPRVEAAEGAAVELVELVAIDGIVEEIGEIVVELQVGTHDIGAEIALAVFARMRKIAGQAEAAGDAAVGRIERAETADDALVDGALRHLIGRVPGVGIGHRRQREPVGRGALAVAHHAVDLAHIVRHVPRAVVFDALDGGEQRARTDRG